MNLTLQHRGEIIPVSHYLVDDIEQLLAVISTEWDQMILRVEALEAAGGGGGESEDAVVQADGYHDPIFIASLSGHKVYDAVLTTGSYADPSWITSLAGTKVTNAVLTTGSYADPSWITSLAGSKVTNAVLTTGSYADPSWITSLAGTKVTNAVLTTGSYADPSWITSLAGTKVTNAVLTTGSYADPAWITSLAGSKVTNAVLTTGSYADPAWITSLAGSKVTNAVLTTGSYADPAWITSLAASKLTGDLTVSATVTTTTGGYRERGRSDGIGIPVIWPYASLTFGANAGTWTVESGDLVTSYFSIVGRTMVYNFCVGTSTISGGSPTLLTVNLPYAKAALGVNVNMCRIIIGGTGYAGYCYTNTSSSTLTIGRLDGGVFSGTNDLYVQLQITYFMNSD